METNDLLLLAGLGVAAYVFYQHEQSAASIATAPGTASTVATPTGVTNLPTLPTGNPGLNTSFAPSASLASAPFAASGAGGHPASTPSYNVGQPGRLTVAGSTGVQAPANPWLMDKAGSSSPAWSQPGANSPDPSSIHASAADVARDVANVTAALAADTKAAGPQTINLDYYHRCTSLWGNPIPGCK